MFPFNRRTSLRQRQPPNVSSASQSFRMSPLYIIVILVIVLCSFSLYLSTEILQPQEPPNDQQHPLIPLNIHSPKQAIPNHQPQAHITNPYQSQQNKAVHNNNDPNLKTAIQKSLHLYLLREGHMDRVEYLIGFRGDRISEHIQYSSLLPRFLNKTYDRDYVHSYPVAISGWQPQPESEPQCDAHCIVCNGACDVGGIRWSMENVEVIDASNIITGSTRLDSLVPVPYFSYWDFGFMTPLNPDKSADALSAAFVSNCGFPKRNEMVRDLQEHGVSVHSYGRCEHNKDEEHGVGGREHTKIGLLSTHKFSLSFENSETDDYISEKFFGTLVSGSVPVYIGAPNIKFFAPDAGNMDVGGPGRPWKTHAVIWAGDFDFDAKKLAEYMLYLDANDTAYNEYIKWKVDGFSGDFKALVELTSGTHTNCRQCILATDWQRYKNGITTYDEPMAVFDYALDDDDDNKWFFIRERGMYRFMLIHIEGNTLEILVKNILQSIKPKEVNKWKDNDHPHYDRIGPALYAIYHIPSKQVINSDESIQNLQNYVELEVIFV